MGELPPRPRQLRNNPVIMAFRHYNPRASQSEIAHESIPIVPTFALFSIVPDTNPTNEIMKNKIVDDSVPMVPPVVSPISSDTNPTTNGNNKIVDESVPMAPPVVSPIAPDTSQSSYDLMNQTASSSISITFETSDSEDDIPLIRTKYNALGFKASETNTTVTDTTHIGEDINIIRDCVYFPPNKKAKGKNGCVKSTKGKGIKKRRSTIASPRRETETHSDSMSDSEKARWRDETSTRGLGADYDATPTWDYNKSRPQWAYNLPGPSWALD